MLGRFLQLDPIGFAGGVNLYGYVGNDPGNGVDPSGKVAECNNSTAQQQAIIDAAIQIAQSSGSQCAPNGSAVTKYQVCNIVPGYAETKGNTIYINDDAFQGTTIDQMACLILHEWCHIGESRPNECRAYQEQVNCLNQRGDTASADNVADHACEEYGCGINQPCSRGCGCVRGCSL